MLAISPEMSAQISNSEGTKAVYNGTTVSTIVGSTEYVDATAWQGTSNDICYIIYQALTHGSYYAPTGVVVDARGIHNTNLATNGNYLTCAQYTSPWLQGSGSSYSFFTSTPTTILLPSASICITSPWIMPNAARLIGAGEFGPYGTVIYAGDYNPNPPAGCSQFGSTAFSDPVVHPSRTGHGS